MEPALTVKQEMKRRSGVPLFIVLFLVVAIAATALIMLWWLGAEAARDGVNDVARSLRSALVADIESQVYHFLEVPFLGMAPMLAGHESGAWTLQRADAYGQAIEGGRGAWALQWLIEGCRQYPSLSAYFYGTERAHFALVDCSSGIGNGGNVNYTLSMGPPADQIRKNVPTWTIPCRYREDCSQRYRGRPDYQSFCESPVDPWAGRSDCGMSQKNCRPYWATGDGSGSRQCPTEPNPVEAPYQCYEDLRPPHATWAHAVHTDGKDPTVCRADATGAHAPCAGFCPEFNRTYYYSNERAEFLKYRKTRSDYDPRSRGWYKFGREQTSRTYTDIYICSSSKMPCTSAMVPMRVNVPDVGAVVIRGWRKATVVGHLSTMEWMHAVRLRYPDNSEEVVDAQEVRMMCTSVEECRANDPNPDKCEDYCAADWAIAGPTPEPARQTAQNKLLAVLGADYEAWSLTAAMDSIEVGKTGGLFITELDEDASLIAVSSSLPCEATKNADPSVKPAPTCFVKEQRSQNGDVDENLDPVRVSAYEDYAGPVVSGVMRSLFPGGSHKEVTEPRSVVTSVGGSDYWVEVVPINPEVGPADRPLGIGGIRWMLFVIVPQEDFLAEANARREETLVISIVVAVVVALILLAVGFGLIAAPIKILIGDLAYAQDMHVDEIIGRMPRFTPLREISELQASFRVMCHALREYRSFLPQSVLDMMDAEEEGQDGESEMPEMAKVTPTPAQDASQKAARPRLVQSGTSGSRLSSAGSRTSHTVSRQQLEESRAKAMGIGISKKSVALMQCNILDFLSVMKACPKNIIEIHSKYLHPLIDAVRVHKGISDFFSGDRFFASFNAARLTPQCRLAAAKCALQCNQVLGPMLQESAKGAGTAVSIAVSGGDVQCGNMGVDTMKKFCCVGSPATILFLAEQQNRRMMTNVIADQKIKDAVSSFVILRMVAFAKFKGDTKRFFEVMGMHKVAEDEWMYQLEEAQKHDPTRAFSMAMELYADGKLQEALEALIADESTPQHEIVIAEIRQTLGL